MSTTTEFGEFWGGLWWVPDGAGKVRNATPGECAEEIKRLRDEVASPLSEARDDLLEMIAYEVAGLCMDDERDGGQGYLRCHYQI